MNGPRQHTCPEPAPSEAEDGQEGWPALVRGVHALLAERGRVALHGPWGSGKSTLLDELAETAEVRCLRVYAQDGDRHLPYAALTRLLDGADAATAPEAQPLGQLTARRATARLLARGGPVLLLIDDVQWMDAASADVLASCLRGLPPGRLGVVAAERTAAYPRTASRLLGGHPDVLPVPPADAEETARLLHRRGLPLRWAEPVHRLCGGHRALLAVCCRALAAAGEGHATAGRHLPDVPREVTEAAAQWLDTLPAEVRATVRAAALAHRPDADLLRQAGHSGADDHLDHAVRAGVLAPAGAEQHRTGTLPVPVRFTARALSLAAARTVPAAERRRAHAAFARAVRDPLHRARHRALAQDGTDQAVAEDTAEAAATAREAGERGLAAELLLLAARLTPADRPAPRLERLTQAAREAAAGGRADLTRHAATLIAEERGSNAQRVHSLLAIIDAQGQDLSDAEPLLAAARTAAAGEPVLLAATELRAAVQANVTGGDTARALHHASDAAALAHQGGDTALQAAALAMTARMQRVLGQAKAAPTTLSAALALAVPPARIGIRNSPEYVSARHAVFDGRLDEARRSLLDLLPAARASGEPEDLVDLWRSLAEVDAGLGSCARAVDWASDALALTASAGISPGPAHYTAALAQSHGGSFAQALRHADQGLRASREENDTLHTTRSLWVLGAVHLHLGHADPAAAALAEVAALEGRHGAADPSVLRWQPDAAEAFAATGRTPTAYALLDQAHRQLDDTADHTALRAALTRARAACADQDGDPERAVALLDQAARDFAALGRAVEEGRTRLLQGRIERRRRRAAAARAAWQAARGAFTTAQARPWITLTEHHLAHLAGRPATVAADEHRTDRLTGNELRLAALICAGATNKEAAQRMFVSPKTVEATLSRIYRKLHVRNRTQLTSTLAPLLDQGGPSGHDHDAPR
ncbi:helix-turn-helix transcriptional regulator [Streptomyces lichenis]|uniref:LuxR C-terminal-related transcriptional regulator n=1 Tax=Streptomyces lichenis TaxID=2306967 RepID=A0ABT0IH40_9ACTN|nr:AAA family ATPase [Streptomyces lichenis]MCK8680647.1 LuxR C-terminal-related transcriptional regulator [Streptomyces lichenis]